MKKDYNLDKLAHFRKRRTQGLVNQPNYLWTVYNHKAENVFLNGRTNGKERTIITQYKVPFSARVCHLFTVAVCWWKPPMIVCCCVFVRPRLKQHVSLRSPPLWPFASGLNIIPNSNGRKWVIPALDPKVWKIYV